MPMHISTEDAAMIS